MFLLFYISQNLIDNMNAFSFDSPLVYEIKSSKILLHSSKQIYENRSRET
jgi:hypothetical protein